MLVKTLISNSEINLEDCELDGNNAAVAYCQVLTWYRSNTVIVTDSESVTAITANKSNSTVSSAERRKRNANGIYAEIVGEDNVVPNIYGKIKNTDLKMQQKFPSFSASNFQQQIVEESELNKRKQQYVQPTYPTEIKPIAEPPTSLENLMEDEQ